MDWKNNEMIIYDWPPEKSNSINNAKEPDSYGFEEAEKVEIDLNQECN